MLPGPELASVHGGNTFTGHSIAMERPSTSKWTFGVLAAAALIGAIAAVAIQVRSHDEDDEDAPVEAPISKPVNKLDFDRPAPPPTRAQAQAQTQTPPPAPSLAQPAPLPTPATTPTATADVTSATPATTQPVAKAADKPSTVESRIAAHRARAAAAAVPKSTKPDAFIEVDEWNGEYAEVAVAGQRHSLPGAKFYVKSGTYKLTDPERQRRISLPGYTHAWQGTSRACLSGAPFVHPGQIALALILASTTAAYADDHSDDGERAPADQLVVVNASGDNPGQVERIHRVLEKRRHAVSRQPVARSNARRSQRAHAGSRADPPRVRERRLRGRAQGHQRGREQAAPARRRRSHDLAVDARGLARLDRGGR